MVQLTLSSGQTSLHPSRCLDLGCRRAASVLLVGLCLQSCGGSTFTTDRAVALEGSAGAGSDGQAGSPGVPGGTTTLPGTPRTGRLPGPVATADGVVGRDESDPAGTAGAPAFGDDGAVGMASAGSAGTSDAASPTGGTSTGGMATGGTATGGQATGGAPEPVPTSVQCCLQWQELAVEAEITLVAGQDLEGVVVACLGVELGPDYEIDVRYASADCIVSSSSVLSLACDSVDAGETLIASIGVHRSGFAPLEQGSPGCAASAVVDGKTIAAGADS